VTFQQLAQPASAWARPRTGHRALRAAPGHAPTILEDEDALDSIRRNLARQVLRWHKQCRAGTSPLELAATLDGLVADLRALASANARYGRAARLRSACRLHAIELRSLAQRLREGAWLDPVDLPHGVDAVLVELALIRHSLSTPARPAVHPVPSPFRP